MITRLLGRLWKLPPPAFAADRVKDLPVPMRDRANLLTDVYHPRAAQNPPTVLMRTPYGRASLFASMARLFAGQGYTTVVQSARGTFGSGGQFDPFFQERDDGVDAVAWIERQPWYVKPHAQAMTDQPRGRCIEDPAQNEAAARRDRDDLLLVIGGAPLRQRGKP
jgi:hypothetical protein